jgi:hypothetical protein
MSKMKLSEAMEAGFAQTYGAREKYYKGTYRGVPRVCPIGAAYVAASGATSEQLSGMSYQAWWAETEALWPELKEYVPYEGKKYRLDLVIQTMVDRLHKPRRSVLKYVKEIGY